MNELTERQQVLETYLRRLVTRTLPTTGTGEAMNELTERQRVLEMYLQRLVADERISLTAESDEQSLRLSEAMVNDVATVADRMLREARPSGIQSRG